MAHTLYCIQLLVARVVELDLRTRLHNPALKLHIYLFTCKRIHLNLCKIRSNTMVCLLQRTNWSFCAIEFIKKLYGSLSDYYD